MVYISSWQEFQDAAEALYAKSPNKTRYVAKWKASEKKLVLKITDDTTCITFKTYSSMFLNRFDALNQSLMEKMQNQTSRPALVEASREEPVASASVTAPVIPTPVPTAAAGGVKKKKKKSKKP